MESPHELFENKPSAQNVIRENISTQPRKSKTKGSSQLSTHIFSSLTKCTDNDKVAEKYEIRRAVGKGKFSVVFHGVIKDTGIQCAVKRITITDLKTETARQKVSLQHFIQSFR